MMQERVSPAWVAGTEGWSGGEVMVQLGMGTKVTQVSRLPARLWLLGTQASQP